LRFELIPSKPKTGFVCLHIGQLPPLIGGFLGRHPATLVEVDWFFGHAFGSKRANPVRQVAGAYRHVN
jgi:hypothetical protein